MLGRRFLAGRGGSGFLFACRRGRVALLGLFCPCQCVLVRPSARAGIGASLSVATSCLPCLVVGPVLASVYWRAPLQGRYRSFSPNCGSWLPCLLVELVSAAVYLRASLARAYVAPALRLRGCLALAWNLFSCRFISVAPPRGGGHFLCCCKESNQRKQLSRARSRKRVIASQTFGGTQSIGSLESPSTPADHHVLRAPWLDKTMRAALRFASVKS